MTPAIQRFERRLLVSAWLLAGCAVAGIAGSVTLDEGTLARHAAAVVAALLGVIDDRTDDQIWSLDGVGRSDDSAEPPAHAIGCDCLPAFADT